MATINNLLNIVFVSYSGSQIDELHHHNQNLVGTLHKGVPTVVYQHENCCKDQDLGKETGLRN